MRTDKRKNTLRAKFLLLKLSMEYQKLTAQGCSENIPTIE